MNVGGAAAHTWDSLPVDHPMALLARRRVIGKQAMISHVTLEQGCFVPVHAHENEQFVCVLSGRMRFRLGPEHSQRREVTVCGGGVLYLPANVPHDAEAIERSVVIDVFSPPSATTGIDQPAHAPAAEPPRAH